MVSQNQKHVQEQISLLEPFLGKEQVFLEIGPGDCSLAFELCRRVERVYGVDVSKTITEQQELPENFQLILSDGVHIDLPVESVDFVFSNQLMEHLHPDDAIQQLQEIYRVLKPGGAYLCITPHRFMGPDDVSQFFDEVATGFHLKEYTNSELYVLFKTVGFSKVKFLFGWRGRHYRPVPITPSRVLEFCLRPFPYHLRKKAAFSPFIRNLLYIKLLATK
jgi:ubiquinone/menaquinone biosynthesis C-methylase UbiE